MQKTLANAIYRAVLLIGVIVIWYNVWLAHQLSYDENFGAIIFAMIFSMTLTLSVTAMWFLTRALMQQNKFVSVAFLVLASPITILLFIYLYPKTGSLFFMVK